MTNIKLYGDLSKIFFKEIQLEVSSTKEAISAISANFPKFSDYIKDKEFHIFIEGFGDIGEEDLKIKTGSRTIKIVPVIKGSGKVFKIILGIVLVVAAPFTGPMAPFITKLGTALIVSGVMELLFAPSMPTFQGGATGEESYNFNGPINTASQGKPVPIGYGQVLVGSAVISAGIHTT